VFTTVYSSPFFAFFDLSTFELRRYLLNIVLSHALPSVHGSLVQVLNDVGPVKEAAAGRVGTAEVLAALNDVVGARCLRVGDAAETSAACNTYTPSCQSLISLKGARDWKKVQEIIQGLPPGRQRPAWPLAATQLSCLRLVLATQQDPLGTGRFWFCLAAMAGTAGFSAAGMADETAARARRMGVKNFILS